MMYNKNCALWSGPQEQFFSTKQITHVSQESGRCVSACLAMLSGADKKSFPSRINTQDPCSWSTVLQEYGMKLAFCSHDVRKVQFYAKELIELNDLFTISYYLGDPLRDPDEEGWVTGSHIVILKGDMIYDPSLGKAEHILSHNCMNSHTKRIFRLVPANFKSGI